jgi:hypothetical protein
VDHKAQSLPSTCACLWQRNLSTFPGKASIPEFKTGRTIRTDKSRPGKHSIVHIHVFILKGLIEITFPSVYSLRKEVMILKTTVLRQLKNSVQLKYCHFERVPHMLTNELHQEYVERSRAPSRHWKHTSNLNFGTL